MWMGSFGFKWLSLNQRSFKRIIVIFVKIVYISLDSDSCLQPKSYPLHLFWINISISENQVSISAGPRSPSSSTASKTKFKTLTKGEMIWLEQNGLGWREFLAWQKVWTISGAERVKWNVYSSFIFQK